ncbi:hypothetical protein KJ564_10185 [bacterium]|nr:hypothetical protein [bacterium]
MLREQKRALIGVIISGATLLATFWFVFAIDPADIFERDDLEKIYLGFLLSGGAAYAIVLLLTRGETKGAAYVYDERDSLIANHALKVQLWTVIGALCLWCVALVRIYIGKSGVPVSLMYLMFLSILLVNILTRSISIFLSYRSDASIADKEDC